VDRAPVRAGRGAGSASAPPRAAAGQSLVELALVLPVLLLLVLIAIDFGRVYLGYVNLQSTARIAANFAANNPTTDWTDNSAPIVATYNAQIAADATATNCALKPDAAGHNPPRPTIGGTTLGSPVTVSLTCSFGLLTPGIRAVFGSSTIDVSASAVFPVKNGGLTGIGGGGGGGGPQVPQANFTASPTLLLVNQSVTFTDTSTNAPTQWTWNFGDGNGSNVQNPVHQYTAAGTFTVSLTAQNADGFTTRTVSSMITVVAPSTVDFSGTPTSGNAPLAVAFMDLSTGSPTAWAWQFGDGATSAVRNPSHTYAAAGTYNVTLTVTDLSGNPTLTKNGYIIVSPQQCTVPNVSDGSTRKIQATSTLTGVTPIGFTVTPVGDGTNWKVRVQNPAGGFVTTCGSNVKIFQ
jgi:PKD repeat protein